MAERILSKLFTTQIGTTDYKVKMHKYLFKPEWLQLQQCVKDTSSVQLELSSVI